jgi:polyisoprenoid-binding protein YceI
MSRKSSMLSASLLLLAGCATLWPAAAPNIASASQQPSDSVWVTGSSNFSTFSCRATQVAVSAQAALEEIDRTRVDGVPAVKSAALAIPVRSLDCGISRMNEDLMQTLGSTANPIISFHMADYVILESPMPRTLRMNGLLRLAGTERKVVVHGSVIRDERGELRLTGERKIDITDYRITPPTKLLGIVRVNREVTVHFNVAIRPLIDPLGILTASLQ